MIDRELIEIDPHVMRLCLHYLNPILAATIGRVPQLSYDGTEGTADNKNNKSRVQSVNSRMMML